MSEFEYVMVAVSILLALAFTRLLDATLENLSGSGDWILSAWLVNRMVAFLLVFWSFRTLAAESGFTLPMFLSMIMPPMFLFLQALALTIGARGPHEVRTTNFMEMRRPFAVCAFCFALSNAFAAYLFEVPTTIAALLVNAGLFAACFFSSSRRVQGFLVLAHSFVLIAAIGQPIVASL